MNAKFQVGYADDGILIVWPSGEPGHSSAIALPPAGALITRRMVEERLAELGGHPEGCGCGLCELVPRVTVSKVWWCASRWQASINQTRLRAHR